MDDILRGNLNFTAYGVTIRSGACPAWGDETPKLKGTILYLNGVNVINDDKMVYYEYQTRDEAESMLNCFRKCIQKFNKENCAQATTAVGLPVKWEIVQ